MLIPGDRDRESGVVIDRPPVCTRMALRCSLIQRGTIRCLVLHVRANASLAARRGAGVAQPVRDPGGVAARSAGTSIALVENAGIHELGLLTANEASMRSPKLSLSWLVVTLSACGSAPERPDAAPDGPDDTPLQQSYITGSNSHDPDRFGDSIAMSADGSTLAVGSLHEASAAT
ncbi:MAG TPA: hypothetical protein VNO30_15270, partial [Kofleriaceae bacterium]|nr:hypothetical protein [Kofleriaceae bacterium]